MKKGVLVVFLVLGLFLAPAVSAVEYACSDGSDFVTDLKEIDLGKSKIVNGVGVAVADSDESTALDTISATFIIDAGFVSLNNETSSLDLELEEETYTVSFSVVNSSSENVKIKVESSSEEAAVEELETIGGLEVRVGLFDNTPGDERVELVAGEKLLTLSSTGEISGVENVGNFTYLYRLVSADDFEARISSSKCATGELVEVAEAVEPEINVTNVTEGNVTEEGESSEAEVGEVNESADVSGEEAGDLTSESGQAGVGDDEEGSSATMFYIIGIIVSLVLVFAIWFFLLRSRGARGVEEVRYREDFEEGEEKE